MDTLGVTENISGVFLGQSLILKIKFFGTKESDGMEEK